jgi:hypothetical protein
VQLVAIPKIENNLRLYIKKLEFDQIKGISNIKEAQVKLGKKRRKKPFVFHVRLLNKSTSILDFSPYRKTRQKNFFKKNLKKIKKHSCGRIAQKSCDREFCI